MLFGISPDAIGQTLLPIGGYEKHEVRAIAEELKLPVFNKPDSQEICFVPNQDYAGLVRRRSPDTFRRGEFVDTSGGSLGNHEGHQHFTIGQRKGLGVATGRRLYVLNIDPASNRVMLGDKTDLRSSELLARQINLLDDRIAADSVRGKEVRCEAKIRYNADPRPAVAIRTADDELIVRFDEPQEAVTPGQAVVLYAGDTMLGGGWIDSAR